MANASCQGYEWVSFIKITLTTINKVCYMNSPQTKYVTQLPHIKTKTAFTTNYKQLRASNPFSTNISSSSLLIASALLCMCFAEEALAQVVPGTVAPGHIEQRFPAPSTEPNPLQPGVPPTIEIPPTAVSGKLAQRFTLRSVQVEDSTVYPAGAFDALFKDKIGQSITLAQAREMAREITTRYRTDGYVLSQAVIPNQDLTTGVLHIRVVEGFVDKVYIDNENPDADSRNLIAGYAAKIRNVHPLNTKTLERYMLLIDDLPGVKARAIVKPSPSTFGAADLVIKVTNKPIEASFTSDNRGNKFLGPYQEQLTLTENSVAGLGERTTVRGINTIPTSDLHYVDIQHEEQIGSEGTRIVAFASYVETHPGDTLSPLELEGKSEDYSLTVSHPFLRSRAQNFTGRFIFDVRNTENDALSTRLNDDKVRAARLGGTYNAGDPLDGVNQIDGLVSQGIKVLGATSDGVGRSRPEGHQEFTKFNLDVSRIQNLPHGFSVLTAASGQYTNDPLLISEQFTLGGVGFGQAYDSGELSGDSGLAGKVELRYGHPVDATWFNSYQLYTYYDVGTVFINDGAPPGTDERLSLASVGAGIRANFTSYLYGYLEAALPLTHVVASEGNKDPRIFFSITGRY